MADKASAAGQQTTTALAGVGQQAQATQAEVAAAFERMGVQTQASLQQAANNALRDFDLIKSSGQATTDGLAKAWKQYAEAAIAANGGVATETLKAQAALQGLEVVVDATGKAIVRAMGSGADAADGYTRTMATATEAVKTHLTWLDQLAKRNAEVKSALITDKDGFAADSKGNRITAGGDLTTLTGIASFLKNAGLDDAQANALAREFSDGKGNIPYFSNPGQMKYGGRDSTMSQALLKAAERTTFGTGGGTTAGAQPIGTTPTSTSHTVRIQINNAATPTTINTASAQDASALSAVLASLQDAASRAR
jgi:murein L,D-transpeptidase YcbB/YkuD